MNSFHCFTRYTIILEEYELRASPIKIKNSSKAKVNSVLIQGRTLTKVIIFNESASKLGYINELILDKREGKIIFAIISFGGIYGFGTRLTAVPWRLLRFNEIHEKYVLNIGSNELYSAPSFDNNTWPDINGSYWSKTIDEFYRDKEQSLVESASL